MRLFDSHLHLTDDAFGDDLDEVLRRATEIGVIEMVTVASNIPDARRAVELARPHSSLWCSAGLHPHEASDMNAAALAEIEALAAKPDVVAIG